MLTFYYHPLSPVARRVWIALLEKEIAYEPVVVDLRGDQHKPEFLALNPFHHVPVIEDDGVRVIESLAILDYLEHKYPIPSLMPEALQARATVRMVQMIAVNEITPKFASLIMQDADPEGFDSAIQHVNTALLFFEQQLGRDHFFGGDRLTLADIVAGSTLALSCRLGVSVAAYPGLSQWLQRLTERESWQKTEPSDRDFGVWRQWLQLRIKRHQRHASPKS